MSFLKLSNDCVAAGKTMLDNTFIREFLPICPENFCKVYIYGLFLLGKGDASPDELEKALSLTAEDVYKAYAYFEEYGLVDILSKDPLSVEYRSLAAGVKPKKIKAGKYQDLCRDIQALIPGRMITPSEFNEYFNLIETYRFEPEALILIIKYCTMIKDNNISYKYITTVAQNWAAKDILTLEACEAELANYNRVSRELGEIFKALGIKGTDKDVNTLYNKWTKEFGFEQENILYVARMAKKTKGGIDRLDELLLELFKNKKLSSREIKAYLESKESAKDCALRINRALGIYAQRLDTEIENYILPWLDYGFSPDALEKLANSCYRSGTQTLEGMHAVVENLFRRGILSEEGIDEYLAQRTETDKFIKKLLDLFKLSRSVNTYDRQNLATWRAWGFSDENILTACEKCKNEYAPIREVHKLLSHCKTNGFFTDAEIAKADIRSSFAPKKQNFAQRDYSGEELDSLFANEE